MEKRERPEPSYIRKIDRPKLTYSVPEAAEILGVSKSKMYELVKELLADETRRTDMTKALHSLVKSDSAERICDMGEELAKS